MPYMSAWCFNLEQQLGRNTTFFFSTQKIMKDTYSAYAKKGYTIDSWFPENYPEKDCHQLQAHLNHNLETFEKHKHVWEQVDNYFKVLYKN